MSNHSTSPQSEPLRRVLRLAMDIAGCQNREDMAKRLDVPPGTFKYWHGGFAVPSIDGYVKIAGKLGLLTSHLTGELPIGEKETQAMREALEC